jgi:hypothetical protein
MSAEGDCPAASKDASIAVRWRLRELPFDPAAGTSSRRLLYPSKNRVDFSGSARTAVESRNVGNYRRLNALAPEVARHQQVDDRADFAFDSRRLHSIASTSLGHRAPSGERRPKCAHHCAHHPQRVARFTETLSDFWRQDHGSGNGKHSIKTALNTDFPEGLLERDVLLVMLVSRTRGCERAV